MKTKIIPFLITVILLTGCNGQRESIRAKQLEEDVILTEKRSVSVDTVSLNETPKSSVTVSMISENVTVLSENSITASENSITVSDNTVSENSVSENSVSEDSISQNTIFDYETPPGILLDMDYCSDVDDVAALKLAAQLHKRGQIRLLAVVTSVEGDYATRALHGQLSYEGLSYIPTGYNPNGIINDTNFLDDFYSRYQDPGTYICQKSVDLYKDILRNVSVSENGKVRIVITGYLSNLRDLLMDEEGYQLVSERVEDVWLDAGAYPMDGMDNNIGLTTETTLAAQYCVLHCPVPIVFTTNETGMNYITQNAVILGRDLKRLDPDMQDPVSFAYREIEESLEWIDTSHGYSGWDGLCVWAASQPLEQCKMKVTNTDIVIYDNGVNHFECNPEGRHYILERTEDNIFWYSEQMEMIFRGE